MSESLLCDLWHTENICPFCFYILAHWVKGLHNRIYLIVVTSYNVYISI